MGQTLTNGIYLPAEGERNCYTGLAANWTALDSLIGGYNAHIGNATIHVTAEDKQAWNNHIADTVKHVTAEDKQAWNNHTGDTTIHVTAEDKQAWNGKADASALTAHTGDTTIHVTATDKQTWDTVTGKADDADVMHLSGNESASGDKNFKDLITTSPSSTLWPVSTRTTDDITFLHYSAVHVEHRGSGNLTDLSNGAWNIANLGTGCFFFRNNSGTDIRYKNFIQNTVNRIYIVSNGNRQLNNVTPETDNTYSLGDSTRRWATINGLNPSSLSLPDLSNGIDISGYITHLDKVVNNYTPLANGWLNIRVRKTSLVHTSLMMYQTGGLLSSCETTEFGISGTNLPVIANQNVEIYIYADALVEAKFYPCQGNI